MKNKEIEFETLHFNKHRIHFLISFVCVVILLGVFIVGRSHARYRVTESIPLVSGTINYSLPDLNIVGLYIDGVEATELDSSKNYKLDTSKSTCTYKDSSIISNLTLSYDSNTRAFSISPYTTKGTKCTLYFEESSCGSACQTILANKTISVRTDFSTTVKEDTTGTIYQAEDDDGTTYYYAGAPTDNWVQFAGFYWRIIRINGDGTIRLIYNGTSTVTTGTGTYIDYNAFNSNYRLSSSVSFGSSPIKGILYTWYQNNLVAEADKIDRNAGFCNDRTSYSEEETDETVYGANNRLASNKAPSFKCENDSDLYTTSGSSKGNKALQYPIGLITADEVSYAGGVYGLSNSNRSYYLYTNQDYWTMSPFVFTGTWAWGFYVDSSGYFTQQGVQISYGVRPVINLSADVIITGSGTISDPYVVQ